MPPLPLETVLVAICLVSVLCLGIAGMLCAWYDHRAAQAPFRHSSWERTLARRAKQAKQAKQAKRTGRFGV